MIVPSEHTGIEGVHDESHSVGALLTDIIVGLIDGLFDGCDLIGVTEGITLLVFEALAVGIIVCRFMDGLVDGCDRIGVTEG